MKDLLFLPTSSVVRCVCVLGISIVSPIVASAAPDILMHLKLDEDPASNGTVLFDSSGNGNDATVINNNASVNKSVTGINGNALHFDGSGDRVDATAFDIPDTFSISLWVNPATTADRQAFLGKHDSNGGNQFVLGFYGGYHVSIRGVTYQAGTPQAGWQHIAVVAQATGTGSTKVTLYRNAVPLWTNTIAAVAGDMAGGLGWTLGQEWDSGPTASDFLTGDMDDVAIWNGALTPADIEHLVNGSTINVTTTEDVIDPGDGLTSLREAVIQANAQPGPDTINLPAGDYVLTEEGADEDASLTGDLDVTDQFGQLTIVGGSVDNTIIDANGIDRALDLLAGTRTDIEGVTLRGGDLGIVGQANRGGGLRHTGDYLKIGDCIFQGNRSFTGGGLFNSGAEVELHGVKFQENYGLLGGGMHNDHGTAVLRNVSFLGNNSGQNGGMYVTAENGPSVVTLLNTLFVGNHAGGVGGGLTVNEGASAEVINSAFVRNVAENSNGSVGGGGGGIQVIGSAQVTVQNSILWGNTGADGAPDQLGGEPLDAASSFNLIEGEPGALTPLFVRLPDSGDGDWTTSEDNDYGDLHQTDSSPGVNAGDKSLLPGDLLTDLDGAPRVRQGVVDLGAYENQTPANFRVDQQATGPVENGLSWETAFTSLQSALSVALDGDHIWLKSGTYKPAEPNGDRSATFLIPEGVQVFGGFSGVETSEDARNQDPDTNGTILSGDLNGNGDASPNDVDNSYHVVTTAAGATDMTQLNGLTIQDGHADGSSFDGDGAGALIWLGSPQFVAVNFKNNRAATDGGGAYNYRGAPNFLNCEFVNNQAYKFTSSSGGGVYSSNDGVITTGPVFGNCVFRLNYATRYGGGLALYRSTAAVNDSTFSENSAERGGGINCNELVVLTIVNGTFNNNSVVGSESGGGAIYNFYSTINMEQTTFTGNQGGFSGGALYNDTGTCNLTEVSFENNQATASGGAVENSQGSSYVQHGGSFIGNGSYDLSTGGGIFSVSDSLQLVGVTFLNNKCLYLGGGAYLAGDSTIVNCTFSGGDASDGAGIYASGCDLTLVNSVLTSNHAQSGGGLDLLGQATNSFILRNVSVAGNSSASDAGGGIRLDGGQLDIANSILWHNQYGQNTSSAASSLAVAGGGSATVANSIVQGSNGSGANWAAGIGTDGGKNLDADPLFVDQIDFTTFPWPAWDLRLWQGSPALNAGADASLPADVVDLDGDLDTGEAIPFDRTNRQRVLGARVDMGAFEGGYTTFARTYPGLNPTVDDNGNGLSNYEDYVLGLDPSAPAGPIEPFHISWDNEYPIINLAVRGNAIDAAFTVEATSNFQVWSPIANYDANLIGSTWPSGDASNRVLNYELFRNGYRSHAFFRLRIDPPGSQ